MTNENENGVGLKGIRELSSPEFEAEAGALATAIAAAALMIAGRRNWSNEAAAVTTFRAAVALLLRKHDAATVVDWLDDQVDQIDAAIPPPVTN